LYGLKGFFDQCFSIRELYNKSMSRLIKLPLYPSLPGVITTITVAMLVVVGFVYVALQQSYRQGANDPQIQIASDTAMALSSGSQAQGLLGNTSSAIDPSVSLAPFTIIVDETNAVVATNMKIGDSTPLPPKGVLNAASVSHQNRITWQPQPGTRIALIVQGYKHNDRSGYVLVGRSLSEIKARDSSLFWLSATTAVVVALLGVFATMIHVRKRSTLAL
jgi:hypothetical protein